LSILNPGEGRRENRTAPRVKSVIPIEVYDGDGLVLLGIGKLYDIGENCAGIETNVVMNKEHVFHLRFLLERKFLIDAKAKVVRITNRASKRYYGVIFKTVDLMHADNLKQYIDKKMKEDPFNDLKEDPFNVK